MRATSSKTAAVSAVALSLAFGAVNASAARADEALDAFISAFGPTQGAARFDLETPGATTGDWEPAPVAGASAYDVTVDGLGRRVRPEEPGVIGAALGGLKERLLAGEN